MKSLSTLAIVASLVISSGAFAQTDTGQAITGAPTDGTKDALEVVVDGQAAKSIYQSMTMSPVALGQGAMVIKRGANISCYANIANSNQPLQEQTEMYLCVFKVNQDGTTKGQY